jgi:hypothetical protein
MPNHLTIKHHWRSFTPSTQLRTALSCKWRQPVTRNRSFQSQFETRAACCDPSTGACHPLVG